MERTDIRLEPGEVVFHESLPTYRADVLKTSECDCPDNPGWWYLVLLAWHGGNIQTFHSKDLKRVRPDEVPNK